MIHDVKLNHFHTDMTKINSIDLYCLEKFAESFILYMTENSYLEV